MNERPLYNPQEEIMFCTNCVLHLEDARITGQFTVNELEVLKNPQRSMTVNFPVRMDDGSTRMITGFRVQYNTALGPAKGGIRIHDDVNFDEVSELSFLMALKTSLAGIPYGGGKGGIKVNPKHLSEPELERVVRGYIRALGTFIGPEVDIPAPDVNSNPKIMAWMLDEFETIVGKKAPGVITGKPLSIGGSKGRDTATARGGYFIARELLRDRTPKETTIAIQGFGNAGTHIAEMLANDGFHIVAVSDSGGALYYAEGLDIQELSTFKNSGGRLSDYQGPGEHITNEELLGLAVDVLIPAALGGVITEKNVGTIQAKTILELANGPISPAADHILEQRGIEVIPGILANAGGVIVSYFEWVQNLQNFYWTAEEVDQRLHTMILEAYHHIRNEQTIHGGSMRLAATNLAMRRIIEAERLRGHIA